MQISRIDTFLMDASPSQNDGWTNRNWLFVKITCDNGSYGIGEASGWPRVVQTAITDLTPLLLGEEPRHIERLWLKLFSAQMGHGMTGVVGTGALTGIEMALWDLKGKHLGIPVWDLLGGKVRDTVPLYAHAHTVERARQLVGRGITAIKTGGIGNAVETVATLRKELGDAVDLMVDLHGPPWMTAADAVHMGRLLEPYKLLFYEDPVAPENFDELAKVAASVDIPIAAGERHAGVWGVRDLITRGIVDVVQPDTGRAGGLLQMRKIAALAEAYGVMMAPHDGSLGPVAEVAAIHLLASIPNCLILEHLEDDVPQRYACMTGQPVREGSVFQVPDAPGLGVDLVEDEISRYPSQGNVPRPENTFDFEYRRMRRPRASWLSDQDSPPPSYRPGSIF